MTLQRTRVSQSGAARPVHIRKPGGTELCTGFERFEGARVILGLMRPADRGCTVINPTDCGRRAASGSGVFEALTMVERRATFQSPRTIGNRIIDLPSPHCIILQRLAVCAIKE